MTNPASPVDPGRLVVDDGTPTRNSVIETRNQDFKGTYLIFGK